MRSKVVSLSLLAFWFALAFPVAVAQKSETGLKYDPSKEVTVKGTIDDVKEVDLGKPGVRVDVMLKTGSETIEVRLCPRTYVNDASIDLTKGQELQVTGSKVHVEDRDVILARELVQGNVTAVLRDAKGDPVWTWLKKE